MTIIITKEDLLIQEKEEIKYFHIKEIVSRLIHCGYRPKATDYEMILILQERFEEFFYQDEELLK